MFCWPTCSNLQRRMPLHEPMQWEIVWAWEESAFERELTTNLSRDFSGYLFVLTPALAPNGQIGRGVKRELRYAHGRVEDTHMWRKSRVVLNVVQIKEQTEAYNALDFAAEMYSVIKEDVAREIAEYEAMLASFTE